MTLGGLSRELTRHKNSRKAVFVAHYFKTGKGEYGEGDVFLGLTVPEMRAIVKKYRELPLENVEKLLHNKIHEYRLTALFILMDKFKKADQATRKTYYNFYLSNTKWINNWDLIDLSARDIVGGWLLTKPKERKTLYTLARSKSIWERRIAMIATFAFLKAGEVKDTLNLAEFLLHDPHDLIHKAVGWLLREVGKIDPKAQVQFLDKHYRVMPRTMLRYAIEKMDRPQRSHYLRHEL